MIAKLTSAIAILAMGAMMSVSPATADGSRYDPDDRYAERAYDIYKRRAAEHRAWEARNHLQRRNEWRHRARRDYDYDRRCLAIARRGGGRGRSIGIYAEGFGRRACRRAMRKCNRRLDIRQSYGRNPFAACVIARRG